MHIHTPTVILNAQIARRNIERMAAKAKHSGVRFRPHFKTHQSAAVGEWFRTAGVEAITVSSLSMAAYFAEHGWQDITVAIPVNWLEIDRINALAARIKLNLLVESVETTQFLQANLVHPVNIWLKIDTGYHRTGLLWDHLPAIQSVANAIQQSDKTRLTGLLTHAGHSYSARSQAAIQTIYQETVTRLQQVKASLGMDQLELSLGDTPCCSLIEDFGAVDEIRPGNFVFYDWMQTQIGSCGWEDIAVAVACPVIAKHADRNTLVLYGGGVHLSKDHLRLANGQPHYGAIVQWQGDGWGAPVPDTYVSSLSQEHGLVKTIPSFFEQVKVGDVLLVLPVHSCMTCDLLKSYQTLDGEHLTMGRF